MHVRTFTQIMCTLSAIHRAPGVCGSLVPSTRTCTQATDQRPHLPSPSRRALRNAEPAAAERPQLGKNFDPASEEALYNHWEAQGYFKPETRPDGDPYTLCMPPPNVTGRLHMGHAMFVALQDIMARYQRMRGRAVLWLPGTDHAGIATQMVVERALAAEGTGREELGRAAFEERVWAWKRDYGGAITQQLRRLGASCDWSREAFTLDKGLSGARLWPRPSARLRPVRAWCSV